MFHVVAPQSRVKALYGEYVSHVPAESEAAAAVHRSLAALPRGRWLLAVSGGRDSMVLLEAMASARGAEIAGVATFDHGTGPAAREACALVERTALALQLPVVAGRMPADAAAANEAAWRAARWRFLEGWADEMRATVVTAHSRDDQIETVVQRLLREAGARGLAGMQSILASTELGSRAVCRPLLEVPRATIADYATARGVRFVEDPSNASLVHQRNRVRHEILPALERAHPGFGAWCWEISTRAAEWRVGVARFVDETLTPVCLEEGELVIGLSPLRALTVAGWKVLWPELAARAGVTMDRRGIVRASNWAPTATSGSEIQLAGGARILRTRTTFVVRRSEQRAHGG